MNYLHRGPRLDSLLHFWFVLLKSNGRDACGLGSFREPIQNGCESIVNANNEEILNKIILLNGFRQFNIHPQQNTNRKNNLCTIEPMKIIINNRIIHLNITKEVKTEPQM